MELVIKKDGGITMPVSKVSMGAGTKIQVARVGDVIPQIKNVDVGEPIE